MSESDERTVTHDGVVVDAGLAHAGQAASLAVAGPLQSLSRRGTSRGSVDGLLTSHPLVEMLPAMMQDDDVSARWVSGLDGVLAPILSTIDNLDAYVDPQTAPTDWLPWLGQWVGLPAEMALDDGHRRRAVTHAGDMFALRGTAQGLRDLIRTTMRSEVEVTDNGGSAWGSAPGTPLPGTEAPWVRVRVVSVEEGVRISAEGLRALVADAVPAHVHVEIELGAYAPATEGAGQ